ncbi:hypothetical protein [Agarivorans sp. OAG1]|uniref:hypothetical protein n=1 Tax=Agarivorans sp. OAG1 TaxID=3082387 RepID=UPI0030CC77F1
MARVVKPLTHTEVKNAQAVNLKAIRQVLLRNTYFRFADEILLFSRVNQSAGRDKDATIRLFHAPNLDYIYAVKLQSYAAKSLSKSGYFIRRMVPSFQTKQVNLHQASGTIYRFLCIPRRQQQEIQS